MSEEVVVKQEDGEGLVVQQQQQQQQQPAECFLTLSDGSGGVLIWDIPLIKVLSDNRIVGRAIGSLPSAFLQNQIHGLPVALLPEQVYVCAINNILKVPPATEPPSLNFLVFADLHSKGYWVTEGFKFGGDYLVYKGSPDVYHASFIVVVKRYEEVVSARQIQVLTRMATTVKKDAVIATQDANGQMCYIKIKWRGVT